jgi:hypothetical protein
MDLRGASGEYITAARKMLTEAGSAELGGKESASMRVSPDPSKRGKLV